MKQETLEQNSCIFCGKTLIEQMKGCTEITCYRQFLKKQETLEEAAEKFIENTMRYSFNSDETKTFANKLLKCAQFGAKWQVERMYSDDEVRLMLRELSTDLYEIHPLESLEEWFEQFKKK